ncbi:hypothetical protein, partial [Muribaculum intestinale]|uniref:hypothetical protein n=1 Tax=Muribaculum intestinale TaxID=1796646 RepID=UPI0025B54B97
MLNIHNRLAIILISCYLAKIIDGSHGNHLQIEIHGNAYLSHQSVESPRMNPYIKSILATAIAASAALT